MNKLLAGVAALALTAGAVSADEVEVMHWWTSGGEAAAVDVLKQTLEADGVAWKDMAVAGGGGEAATTALKARVTAGDPPTAAQMLGNAVQEWAAEGLMGNLDEIAGQANWAADVPEAVKAKAMYDGHWVAVPVNVHRPHWVWANAKVFADNGLSMPTNWDEFFAAADKLQAAGVIPVAVGGQPWQEATIWEAIVLSVSPEFYQKAAVEGDPEALGSAEMVQVFDTFRKIRGYVDPNFANRDWNLATQMVLKGEAGMQIMGDWAKGEITAAGVVPGVDILCAPTPGSGDSFLFISDFFAMFDVGADKKPAQDKLAAAILNPSFQEAFNLKKGSIPANSTTPMDKFDACAQTSAKDMATATAAGHLFPSLAHQTAQPAAVTRAYFDVITQFFNSDQSSEDAVKALVAAVAAAKG